MKKIGLVVEGDGEQGAVPIIGRAHLHSRGIYDVDFSRPINAKGRSKLLRLGELERFAKLAALQAGVSAVLVTCDADSNPYCELGPAILERCNAAIPHVPVRVCVAVREFENWLFASHETLSPGEETPVSDYEGISAVGRVAAWRAPRAYVKPVHQPAMAARMDHNLVGTRCPSFARLLRCIDELVAETRGS
jgi:Domain of unknown function (DUF4276)